METKTPSGNGAQGPASKEGSIRRKKKNQEEAGARVFLPKPGSSLHAPELGQEMPNEGEALIEALKSGQPFFILKVFRAVAQQNGGYPVITKQPVVNSESE